MSKGYSSLSDILHGEEEIGHEEDIPESADALRRQQKPIKVQQSNLSVLSTAASTNHTFSRDDLLFHAILQDLEAAHTPAPIVEETFSVTSSSPSCEGVTHRDVEIDNSVDGEIVREGTNCRWEDLGEEGDTVLRQYLLRKQMSDQVENIADRIVQFRFPKQNHQVNLLWRSAEIRRRQRNNKSKIESISLLSPKHFKKKEKTKHTLRKLLASDTISSAPFQRNLARISAYIEENRMNSGKIIDDQMRIRDRAMIWTEKGKAGAGNMETCITRHEYICANNLLSFYDNLKKWKSKLYPIEPKETDRNFVRAPSSLQAKSSVLSRASAAFMEKISARREQRRSTSKSRHSNVSRISRQSIPSGASKFDIALHEARVQKETGPHKLEKLQRQHRWSETNIYKVINKQDDNQKAISSLENVLTELTTKSSNSKQELQSVITNLITLRQTVLASVEANTHFKLLENCTADKRVSMGNQQYTVEELKHLQEENRQKYLKMQADYLNRNMSIDELKKLRDVVLQQRDELHANGKMLKEFYAHRYYRNMSFHAKDFWSSVLRPILSERDELSRMYSISRTNLENYDTKLSKLLYSINRLSDVISLMELSEWLDNLPSKIDPKDIETIRDGYAKNQPTAVAHLQTACNKVKTVFNSAVSRNTANHCSFNDLTAQLLQTHKSVTFCDLQVNRILTSARVCLHDKVPDHLRKLRDDVLDMRERKRELEEKLYVEVQEEYQNDAGEVCVRVVKKKRASLVMDELARRYSKVLRQQSLLVEQQRECKYILKCWMDVEIVKMWQRALGMKNMKIVQGSTQRLQAAFQGQLKSLRTKLQFLDRKLLTKKVLLARLTGDHSLLTDQQSKQNAKHRRASLARIATEEAAEALRSRQTDAFNAERKLLKQKTKVITNLLSFWNSRFIQSGQESSITDLQPKLRSVPGLHRYIKTESTTMSETAIAKTKIMIKKHQVVNLNGEKMWVEVEREEYDKDSDEFSIFSEEMSPTLSRVMTLLSQIGLLSHCLKNNRMISVSKLLVDNMDDAEKISAIQKCLKKVNDLPLEDQGTVINHLYEIEQKQQEHIDLQESANISSDLLTLHRQLSNQVLHMLKTEITRIRGHSTLTLGFTETSKTLPVYGKDTKQSIMSRAAAIHRQVQRMRQLNKLTATSTESGQTSSAFQKLQDIMFGGGATTSLKDQKDVFWDVQKLLGKFAPKLKSIQPEKSIYLSEIEELTDDARVEKLKQLAKATLQTFEHGLEKLQQMELSDEKHEVRRELELSMHKQKVEFTALIGREDARLARKFILQMRDIEKKVIASTEQEIKAEEKTPEVNEEEIKKTEKFLRSAFLEELSSLKKEFEVLWNVVKKQQEQREAEERQLAEMRLVGEDSDLHFSEHSQAKFLRNRQARKSHKPNTNLDKMKEVMSFEQNESLKRRNRWKRMSSANDLARRGQKRLDALIWSWIEETEETEKVNPQFPRRISDLAAEGKLNEQQFDEILRELKQEAEDDLHPQETIEEETTIDDENQPAKSLFLAPFGSSITPKPTTTPSSQKRNAIHSARLARYKPQFQSIDEDIELVLGVATAPLARGINEGFARRRRDSVMSSHSQASTDFDDLNLGQAPTRKKNKRYSGFDPIKLKILREVKKQLTIDKLEGSKLLQKLGEPLHPILTKKYYIKAGE